MRILPVLPVLTLSFLLTVPLPSRALTLTHEPLDTTYEYPPPGLVRTIGRTPLAIAGGLMCGLALFAVWKIRRAGRGAGLILILLATTGIARRADACANIEESTLENSYTKYLDSLGWFSKPVERALAASPADDPHVTPDPDAYATEPVAGIRKNDEAVRMVLKGNPRGALEKLKQIEADHPGLYATAANLGTCYELIGDDVQALHWIREGLERNPYSHMLAEWLHVRVLEAKIALKSDPSWLNSHTITGLDPDQRSFETLQGNKDTEGVLASLRSQCTVRALFIKPQDPVMAQLLYEAATFMLDERANSVASTLALAMKYGLPPARAAGLQAKADRIMESGDILARPTGLGVWMINWKAPLMFLIALGLGFVIPMYYVLRKENSDG
ncbi:MAG: hypothetical protein EOP86_13450 [Verrucomicrobiaceae bacterium]|nr:MAG: hypothetical protein EOP86_13450 [Verrucomicrobiaceae bacterium]